MKRAKKDWLAIPSGVEVSPVGLKITGRLSYDEWVNMVEGLQRAHCSILWVLGDGFVYGEKHWPEKFSQAIAEYSKQTSYNAHWVSRQINSLDASRD